MSPCRRFGLALRGHRTHLHDRSRQTDARSLAQRDSLLQLRDAFQLHDWQMLTAGRVADRKIQSNTASASNAGARCSARGAAGPVSSRLKPRCEASGCETLVNLVRCSTIECFAWPPNCGCMSARSAPGRWRAGLRIALDSATVSAGESLGTSGYRASKPPKKKTRSDPEEAKISC